MATLRRVFEARGAWAWHYCEQGNVGAAGIGDRVPVCIMRQFGLTDAFANGRYFASAGFAPLF